MSTSSNECEWDHSQNYGAWPNEMESPWYPTFGQPLIYYSQVQPIRRRQRLKEPESDKPNCFKKAFRWYTQEHVPFKNGLMDSSSNINKPDVKGFAAWLDKKYNEFLQSSQVERPKYIVTQTSAVEMDRVTSYEQLDKQATKKHKRVKSPWKKREKYLKSKEKGDVLLKSNQSIEIILKPKDLSHPASECCQSQSRTMTETGFVKAQSGNLPKIDAFMMSAYFASNLDFTSAEIKGVKAARPKARSCCNRSSSTVESNASTSRVTKQKSQSLTSVKEREMHMMPFDIPDYYAKKEKRETEKSSNNKILKRDSKWKRKNYRPRHVSCQCSKFIYEKVDANIQVENKEIKQSDPCHCRLNGVDDKTSLDNLKDVTEIIITSETKTSAASIHPNAEPDYTIQLEESSFTAPSTSTQKNRAAFLAPASECVQTSNYSINLSPNVFPDPLFMKIICADKLKGN